MRCYLGASLDQAFGGFASDIAPRWNRIQYHVCWLVGSPAQQQSRLDRLEIKCRWATWNQDDIGSSRCKGGGLIRIWRSIQYQERRPVLSRRLHQRG
jgi:hypothetical protein